LPVKLPDRQYFCRRSLRFSLMGIAGQIVFAVPFGSSPVPSS
jgi:hypothetical protein